MKPMSIKKSTNPAPAQTPNKQYDPINYANG